MSGIFGFANLDGRPVSRDDLQPMAEQMAGWGPDGLHTITAGSAALGHALLIVTHESRFEKMPFRDEEEKITFTAAARLDNRDELCDYFSIPHPERPVTSDGRLAYLAYKKWGRDACKKLYGDWSFAAWHELDRKLILARDHLGNTGLYYYFKPPLLVFASSIQAVLAQLDVPRALDELHLAQNLGYDLMGKDYSRTFWRGVRLLPAAHAVVLQNSDKHIDNFWRMDNVSPTFFKSDEAYLEGFLDHFRRAVRVRLNSIRPVGSTLSAGLDSSAVTALAAEALQKKGDRIFAFTSVPVYPAEEYFPGKIANEWPLAHELAEKYKNVEHVAIPGDDITPIEAIKASLRIFHMPQHAAANMFWILSMLENAKRRNIGILLTGQLGNGGISWSGGSDRIFYLLTQNHLLETLRALSNWRKQRNFSWFRAIKSQILRPLFLPFLSQYRQYFSPGKTLNYSYPQRDFIKRLGLMENSRFNVQSKPMDPLTERHATMIRNGTYVGPFWNTLASHFNMAILDPTADIRLLEFCIGLPHDQMMLQGGQRMLIRKAMEGILPDEICWNTSRGQQSADIFKRLIAHKKEAEEALEQLETASSILKYLNIKDMRHIWASFQAAPSAHPADTSAFLRAMNTGYFLMTASFCSDQALSDDQLRASPKK